MKAGTTASLFTFLYLREMLEALRGRMTLSIVPDEETFGPRGVRYLFEHHPEVIGDCCLNAEPSSPAWRRVKKEQFVMVAGARSQPTTLLCPSYARKLVTA